MIFKKFFRSSQTASLLYKLQTQNYISHYLSSQPACLTDFTLASPNDCMRQSLFLTYRCNQCISEIMQVQDPFVLQKQLNALYQSTA